MVLDTRLLDQEDTLLAQQFPAVRSIGSQRARFCMVCQVGKPTLLLGSRLLIVVSLYCTELQANISSWVVRRCSRLPADPYFFCVTCYRDFNFVKRPDEAACKKIGSFEAFRYFDPNTL